MHTPDAQDRPITKKERFRLAGVLCIAAGIALASQTGCAMPQATAVHADASWSVPGELATGESAAYIMRRAQLIMSLMADDYGIKTLPVDWSPCDEVNAYYDDGTGAWGFPDHDPGIHICAEMLAHPDLTMQAAAHEFGHRVTDVLASTTDENSADEIAILAMVRHGYWDEMLGGAIYMRANWPAAHMPGDPHPGAEYRAWEYACAEAAAEGMADPSRPASAECNDLYRGLLVKWDTRLPRKHAR